MGTNTATLWQAQMVSGNRASRSRQAAVYGAVPPKSLLQVQVIQRAMVEDDVVAQRAVTGAHSPQNP